MINVLHWYHILLLYHWVLTNLTNVDPSIEDVLQFKYFKADSTGNILQKNSKMNSPDCSI